MKTTRQTNSENPFNEAAIINFGIHHSDMDVDAPNVTFTPEIRPLTNYLDIDFVYRHALTRLPEERGKCPSVLDIGAGKGRMTRHFIKFAERVVAIEPYQPFFEILKTSCQKEHCEVYCKDLNAYSMISQDRFDLIYISGVTPYLNDDEFQSFMKQITYHLQPWGVVCIRDLGHERRRAEGDLVVHRTPQENINTAKEASLMCVYWRRSYPLIIFNKLYEKWPNSLSRLLLRESTRKWTYSLWRCLAELNIPRGGRMCFMSYVFEHQRSSYKGV